MHVHFVLIATIFVLFWNHFLHQTVIYKQRQKLEKKGELISLDNAERSLRLLMYLMIYVKSLQLPCPT